MRNGDGRGCWLCDLLVGGVRELSLFSGAGGGLLGTKLLGFRHVGYVEWNEYCQQVIAARIRDGNLDGAPIFGDIDTFISEGYADAYKGMVDVVSGGFPCQPYSSAGKQLGENDPKDRWPATREVIRRVRPKFCLLENVPRLISLGYLGKVLGDLAEMGFNAEWGVVSSAAAGANHVRERLWIFAYADGTQLEGGRVSSRVHQEYANACRSTWWEDCPPPNGVDDGMANRVERLKAIGNGQSAIVAASAWEILSRRAYENYHATSE